jgi:hypothetical protein
MRQISLIGSMRKYKSPFRCGLKFRRKGFIFIADKHWGRNKYG